MRPVTTVSYLLMSVLVLGPQPSDPGLAARIAGLLHTVITTDNESEERVATAEARQQFLDRGLPTVADVGDEAAYEFVVLICTYGPADVQVAVLTKAKRAVSRHELAPDAERYCEARLRLDRVKARAAAHPPTNTALRDEIERLYPTDQAVRQQKDFDSTRMQSVDREHAAALQAILDRYGVPTYAMVGTSAAAHFVVLLQHQAPELRTKALPKLKRNVDAGQADPESYAMMYDRSRRDAGLKQRFGESLECTPQNPTLHEAQIEDELHVNQRRADLGLIRIELYTQILIETSPPICSALQPGA